MTKCLINDEDAKLIKRMEELQNSMRNIILDLRKRKPHPDQNEVISRMEFADRELAGAIGYFIAESLLYCEERTEMTITKHGNKWYHFVCPCCGCEWTAGVKEVRQGTVVYDDRIEEAMFCNCPECGHDFIKERKQ